MSEAQFDVDGVRFTVKRLKYEDAARGLALLGDVLGPALQQFTTGAALADLIPAVAKGIGRLPELVRLFAPRTEFVHTSGRTVAFSEAFAEDVFGAGRLDRAIEYVANCIHTEYGSFLHGDALEQLGQRLAKLFPAPKAPTLPSGASS